MYLEFRIGTPGKTGYTQPQALGDASVAVSEINPRYATLASRGLVYTLSGAVAGTVGQALGSTPLVGIAMPQSATVQAMILSCTFGLTETAGTSVPVSGIWGITPAPSGVTAASATAPTSNLTFKAAGSQALGFVSQAATGLTTPVVLRPINAVAGLTAALTGISQAMIREDTNGEVICLPGAFVGIYSQAAGTTPLIVCSMTWAEIPVASL